MKQHHLRGQDGGRYLHPRISATTCDVPPQQEALLAADAKSASHPGVSRGQKVCATACFCCSCCTSLLSYSSSCLTSIKTRTLPSARAASRSPGNGPRLSQRCSAHQVELPRWSAKHSCNSRGCFDCHSVFLFQLELVAAVRVSVSKYMPSHGMKHFIPLVSTLRLLYSKRNERERLTSNAG